MALDKDLVMFLDKKRKSDVLRAKPAILEIFDSILPNIEELYKEKLCERDSEDEFQVDRICQGTKTEDGSFYVNYFLPSCILFMYQLWLESEVAKDDIFNDLFTIGAGSGTMDLFPEVTGASFTENNGPGGLHGPLGVALVA